MIRVSDRGFTGLRGVRNPQFNQVQVEAVEREISTIFSVFVLIFAERFRPLCPGSRTRALPDEWA